MKKPQLTKKESELYLKIVTKGNMDDMFDFGYCVGRERLAKENLELIEQRHPE